MSRHHINYLKALRNGFIGFVVAFAVYWIVQLLWWEFFPYKTADIKEPIAVLNEGKSVSPGDTLDLQIEFTKYSNLTPTVSRNIVCLDETVHFINALPPTGVARPIGTFIARSSYPIPDTIPRNIGCYFQFTNEYQVNPIRVVEKVWISELFKVE